MAGTGAHGDLAGRWAHFPDRQVRRTGIGFVDHGVFLATVPAVSRGWASAGRATGRVCRWARSRVWIEVVHQGVGWRTDVRGGGYRGRARDGGEVGRVERCVMGGCRR